MTGSQRDGKTHPAPSRLQNGYAKLCRYWNVDDKGHRQNNRPDVIELDLPMPVRRIEAHPRGKDDVGRGAIQRGPLVYCFEGVDNPGRVRIIFPARVP